MSLETHVILDNNEEPIARLVGCSVRQGEYLIIHHDDKPRHFVVEKIEHIYGHSDEKFNRILCHVKELKPKSYSLSDAMKVIYNSDYFTTSGANTNNIQNNPRLIGLVVAVITSIDIDWLSSHQSLVEEIKSTVMSKWNNKNIKWSDLDFDDIPAIETPIEELKDKLTACARRYQITPSNIWPIFK